MPNIRKIEDSDKVKIYSIEISERIAKINEVYYSIVIKTQEIIKKIEEVCAKALKSLKELKEKYICILEKKNFDEPQTKIYKYVIIHGIEALDMKFIEKYYDEICEKKRKLKN